MKPAFSLLELVIAIFIASIMTLGLYQLLRQTRATVSNVVQIIDTDVPLLTFYNQLERDILGMFIPRSSEEHWIKEKGKSQEAENKKEEISEPKEKKEQEVKKQDENKSEKPIDNVFYLENKNGEFIWSFITTAALQKYDKKELVNSVPYVRRVAYKLEKDLKNPKLHTLLYRYSTDDLTLKNIEKADFKPSYEIIGNIKNLSFEFTVFEAKKEDKKDKENGKSIALNKWIEGEMVKKYESLIPAYITVKGSLTDNIGKSETPFEFQFKIPAYHHIQKEEKRVPSDPKELFSEIDKLMSKHFNGASGKSPGGLTS